MNTLKDLAKYIEDQLNDKDDPESASLEVYYATCFNDKELIIPCEFNIGGYVWVNTQTHEAYYNEYGDVDEPPAEIKENFKRVYCIN